jgi:hypothetical protein
MTKVNWWSVAGAGVFGAAFAVVVPIWVAVLVASALGIVVGHFLPAGRRHRRHVR